jgi:outer membrane autotransporter protein
MRMSLRSLLLAGSVSLLSLSAVAQTTTTATLNGTVFTNQGLQGVGRLPASLRDKFGETFGSISAMQIDTKSWRRRSDGTYSGTLYALPDRGYNVASTTNYAPRYNILDLTFNPYTGTAAAPAQNQIGLTLRDTVQFRDSSGGLFSGLDPGAGGNTATFRPASGNLPNLPLAGNGRLALDAEGFALSRDGSLWVSDEYGPYIYRFSAEGMLLSVIRPPQALVPQRNGADNFSATEGVSLPVVGVNPQTGRQNNQGLEGLSLSPDGRTLFTVLQSAAVQDVNTASINTSRRNTRLLAYDVSNPSSAVLRGEWVVQLPLFNSAGTPGGPLNRVAAQSELVALNNTQFLLLSRDGNGFGSLATPTSSPASLYRRIDLLDITGATNIAGTAFDSAATPIAPNGVLSAAITPVQFSTFIDMNDASQLSRFGLVNGAANNPNCRTQCLSEKWEALSLVPVLDRARLDDFFLFVGNDNDFVTQNGFQVGAAYRDASGVENDTTILAYRLTLPTYVDGIASESQSLTAGLLGRALAETALAGQQAAASDLTGRTQAIRAGFAARRVAGSVDLSAGGDWSRIDRDDSSSRRTAKALNWSLGGAVDYALTDSLLLGIGFGYADTNGKFGTLGRADGRSWAVGPYVTLQLPSGFYADASYRYVDSRLKDIERTTFAYDLTATGQSDGTGRNISVEVGQVFTADQWRFGPLLSFSHDRVRLGSWSEDNALHLNLDHPGQTITKNQLGLTGHLSTSIDLSGGMVAVPELRVGWQKDLSEDNRRTYTTTLSNRRSSALAVQTATLGSQDNSGWRVGTGMAVAVNPTTSLLVNADALFARGSNTDLAVGVGVRVGF